MMTASMSPAVETGVCQRALGGLRRDRGRVLRKSRVEHVRIEVERLAQVIEREMPAADAVVAAQHFPQDRLRSRAERRQGSSDATTASQHCVCVQRVDGAAVPSPLRNIP